MATNHNLPQHELSLIKTYLQEQTAADRFSGAALVAHRDHVLLEYASGYANRITQTPNTVRTKFNLGSINKLFTAVAIAQLIEKKDVHFDDPVGKFLPMYPNQTVREEVTLHHLLTHTSGLGSFIDVKYRPEFLAARSSLTTISHVVTLFQDKPLETSLEHFCYSANGFELLGRIIEVISEQDYYEYIRQNIYQPANMPNTDCYLIDPDHIPPDIAIGYTHRDPLTDHFLPGDKFDNFGLNLFKGTASGSGYSTCHDLLHFSQGLMNYQLLSKTMIEQLFTSRLNLGTNGNQTKFQAYGFQVFHVGKITRIGHPGRFAGINTRFDMYPDLDFTVMVLSNYDPPAAFDVAEKIGEYLSAERES